MGLVVGSFAAKLQWVANIITILVQAVPVDHIAIVTGDSRGITWSSCDL